MKLSLDASRWFHDLEIQSQRSKFKPLLTFMTGLIKARGKCPRQQIISDEIVQGAVKLL